MLEGHPCWECLWSIKYMLHGFELSYGLAVNFHKSRVIGVNIDAVFMKATYEFLSRAVSNVPFSFLGIPIG